ncbi:MAG: zinc ribbon domain-containing protein [Desulfobacteraceae bacterium]|nr:zinc ribbon domain-containing protein [Desulfobacteraceae bacterium]
MPIYEYYCEACDKKFETLVRGGEVPVCPKCGQSRDLKKLLSACGFVSKGEGGETVSASAGSSCGSCASTGCAGCGI